MFPALGSAKIFLCREAIDMRKSFDTLEVDPASRTAFQ